MGGGPPQTGPTSKEVILPQSEDLTMLLACFCVKYSLYTKMPDCIGCTSKGEVLCYKSAQQVANHYCIHVYRLPSSGSLSRAHGRQIVQVHAQWTVTHRMGAM